MGLPGKLSFHLCPFFSFLPLFAFLLFYTDDPCSARKAQQVSSMKYGLFPRMTQENSHKVQACCQASLATDHQAAKQKPLFSMFLQNTHFLSGLPPSAVPALPNSHQICMLSAYHCYRSILGKISEKPPCFYLPILLYTSLGLWVFQMIDMPETTQTPSWNPSCFLMC